MAVSFPVRQLFPPYTVISEYEGDEKKVECTGEGAQVVVARHVNTVAKGGRKGSV